MSEPERLASVGFGCTDGGRPLAVRFFWASHFYGNSAGEVRVEYSIEPGEAYGDHYWLLRSDNSENVGATMPSDLVPSFRSQAEAGRVVVLVAKDPGSDAMERRAFSLKGMAQALSHLPCAQED